MIATTTSDRWVIVREARMGLVAYAWHLDGAPYSKNAELRRGSQDGTTDLRCPTCGASKTVAGSEGVEPR